MPEEKDKLFLTKFVEELGLNELGLKEPITLDSILEDLGWDSLAVITAIAVFDEVYGITLDVDKLNKCKTIKDIVKLSEI